MRLGPVKIGEGAAIFAVFFAIAALEAFRNQSWLEVGAWLVIGLAFLGMDNMARSSPRA